MKRLLLFVHYDRDGRLDDHILYLLSALVPFRAECAVLANSPLSAADEARLAPVADRVIRRENKGFDFGAWADGLREYETRLETEFDAVLLVNGSCFGPLFPLAEMFESMEKHECDFWGVTEHTCANGAPAHLQSYFMEIRKPMLVSPAFRRFFREVGAKCTTFENAVKYGEIGFSQAMRQAGFRYRTFIRMADLRSAPNAGIGEAFSRNCAPFMIRRYRLPFLKIKAFGQTAFAPVFRGGEIGRALRESGSDYPQGLITGHLRRTAPLSWQKNLPDALVTTDRNAPTGDVPPLRIGVFFHCFRPESAARIAPYLANFPAEFDVLATSPDPAAEAALKAAFAGLPKMKALHFRRTPNRGRDVAPWLCAFPAEQHLGYDVALKLHVKTSPQMPEAFTEAWLDYTYDNLAGSPALIAETLRAFAADPELGTVFPPYPPAVTLQCPTAYAGHPLDAAEGRRILRELELDPPPETGMPVFSPGTMFWYRPKALENLLKKGWSPEDFPPEPLPWRGTAAHAMERIVPYIMQANGYFFRQGIHADRLAEAFRTYENRAIYFKPALKPALKTFLEALKTSLAYRLGRFF